MARTLKKGSSGKPRLSSRKANATRFFTKRNSLKSKAPNVSDLYEYQSETVRRSKVALELDRHEAEVGHGGDESEGEERRAWLIGERGDDEKVDSGNDEEIDSDDAFEKSDDERFAGFNFSQKVKRKVPAKKKPIASRGVRFADVDLHEAEEVDDTSEREKDDDEDEQGDADDEFIDILDVLDGKGEADDDDETEERTEGISPTFLQKKPSQEENGSDDEDEADDMSEGSEDGVDSDEDHVLSASDAENSPAALEELGKFISNLEPSAKRKLPLDSANNTRNGARPKKRKTIEERTEAGVENEFHAQTYGSKLDLNDLLAPLASHSPNFLSLKASTKVLASSSSTKVLAAPLPQRTQEKLDREAAYEQTKEEVDKWSATMKHIKEAEHLSFPLQSQRAGRSSNSELTAKFKPTTELETSIDQLLKSAKMREEDIQQTEALKMNHLSVEEVAARREELQKMRELLFRADVKAKRVAKIKSKTYRRIRRKEQAKLAAKLDGEVDEEDESVRLKREMDRARERATLRHKHTGKWAKERKTRGELNIDERREISAMLERGELLRKKIRGDRGSDEAYEDDEDDQSDGHPEGDISTIKASAFEELARLDKEPESLPEGSGIFSLKFMKNAMARDRQQADKLVDDFVKELGGHQDEGIDTDEDQSGGDAESSGVATQRTGGRVTYRPSATNKPLLATRSKASDTSSVTLKSTDIPPISPTLPSERPIPISPLSADASNPWLTREVVAKASRKRNELVVGKDSAVIEKSKHKLKKQTKKRDEEREKAREDATVEISMSDVLTLGHATSPPPPPSSQPNEANPDIADSSPPKPNDSPDDSDANSEVEEQEKVLTMKGKANAKGLRAFEQRDLVALAFAGDNVVKEFRDAKRREIAADAPREVDTTLPGWGAWGGAGTRPHTPKPHLVKKIAGVDPKSRADFKKAHVIISEKRDKKAAKYLVKDLPFPYTSQAQFERSLERPLGTEWNTRLAFQRGTLPRVVKKMGTIIDPLTKLF